MIQHERPHPGGWRAKAHEIIFEADTPTGKLFDVVLIFAIIASVLVVMCDSVRPFREAHGQLLSALEWTFTILFTIEYMLRLSCVGRPIKYATSFLGVIDLLAIAPSYLGALFFPGSHYFLVIRMLRLLRIFRVLKLVQYMGEARELWEALRRSRRKIVVFLFTVITAAVIVGAVIYVVEGEENGFTSIPRSVYWAIVTLTTVGYGDISPQTGFGQALAAMLMILGYSIIVVPTGFVTLELARKESPVSTQACPQCSAEGHDSDATHCKFCGARL